MAIKIKNYLGKSNVKRPSEQKLIDEWSSDEITNKIIKDMFKDRIKWAKKKKKEKS